MAQLTAMLHRVTPEHMAWHETFRFAVLRKLDGSLWVRDAHTTPVYEYPAHDAYEVFVIVGFTTATDTGWRLL